MVGAVVATVEGGAASSPGSAFPKQESQLLAPHGELSGPQMVELVKEAFTVAGERDIYTGDSVEIFLITRDGVQVTRFALKDD